MRCYVHPDDWSRPEILLDAEESHHVLRVMRKQVGDAVEIFNGAGGRGEAAVSAIRGDRVALAVRQRSETPRPCPSITLVPAVPREQKMDFVIQKATEIGAAAIAPVLTRNGVVRLTGERAAEKKPRWEKIALAAAKQSGNPWLPRIEAPRPLAEFLKSRPSFDLFLVCALHPEAAPLRDVVAARRERKTESIGVLVGPEGDFTADELQAILSAGALPVSLGGNVLRAETAALYVLSVLRHEFPA